LLADPKLYHIAATQIAARARPVGRHVWCPRNPKLYHIAATQIAARARPVGRHVWCPRNPGDQIIGVKRRRLLSLSTLFEKLDDGRAGIRL
jgi:hypothetical protein